VERRLKELKVKCKTVEIQTTLHPKFCAIFNDSHNERGKLLTDVILFLSVIFPKVELYRVSQNLCHKLFLGIPHPHLSKKVPINMGPKVNRFEDIYCCVEIREML